MNYWRKTITTRTVQNAAARMIGQTHGDITAALAHKELGRLNFNQGLGITAEGTIKTVDIQGGPGFDSGRPPAVLPFAEPLQWWVPGDDWELPSVLVGQSGETPVDVTHDYQGTGGGNGSGKLITLWEAKQYLMRVSGRLLARIEQKLDGVPGYRAYAAKHVARMVVGRSSAVALATCFSNVLEQDRRRAGSHYISTRRWKANKFVGRHCGYAAYYRKPGRPALPLGEAQRRERERLAKRRKHPNGKLGKVPKIKPTVNPRPTYWEYHNRERNPVAGDAKILNERRGRAWAEGWEEMLRENLRKPVEDIAQEFGEEAAKYLTRKAIEPFFRWLRKGAEETQPADQQNTLNTPTVR